MDRARCSDAGMKGAFGFLMSTRCLHPLSPRWYTADIVYPDTGDDRETDFFSLLMK